MKKNIIEEIGNKLQIMSTHAILRSYAIALKLGINTTDLECLEVLIRLGKTTAGLLSSETGLTTGAVTKMIDRLEKAGFVERQFDKADRRKVYIVLKSKPVTEQVVPLYSSLSNSINKKLSTYSTNQLKIILDFLSDSIEISTSDLKHLSKIN